MKETRRNKTDGDTEGSKRLSAFVRDFNRIQREKAVEPYSGDDAFNLDEVSARWFIEKAGLKCPTDAEAFETRLKVIGRRRGLLEIEDVEALFVYAFREELAPLRNPKAGEDPFVRHVFPYLRALLDRLRPDRWREWRTEVAALSAAGGGWDAPDGRGPGEGKGHRGERHRPSERHPSLRV